MTKQNPRDGRFATLVDNDGNPPCSPPDDCTTCRLFTRQRTGESRPEWLSRITAPPYGRIS